MKVIERKKLNMILSRLLEGKLTQQEALRLAKKHSYERKDIIKGASNAK